MKKLFRKIVIILAIIVVVVVLLKDRLVKMGVEQGVRIISGLRLHMDDINVGVLKTLIDVKGLVLYNPADFEDKIMVDMPNIYVNYNLPEILKRKVHLYEAKLNLKEFVVVKNKNGKLNLDSLKVVQAQKEGKKSQEKEKAKTPEIQIDKLQLKIGKVIYKDYSKGSPPAIKEFNVNIDETYSDIKDPYALASLIVVKALMNTTIAGLANFDLKGLSNTIGDTLSKAGSLLSETTEKIKDEIKFPFIRQ